jgi:hypothetical protein
MFLEVQEWLRAGKPVPRTGDAANSPLALAAANGFHSLVKVLLDLGQTQECLDAALAGAGAGGHLETCRLLLDRGAGIRCVRAAEVVRCGNPEAAGLLLLAGMDVTDGNALARAMVDRSKEAVAFFRRWRRRSKAVRRQGAMALKHFVIEDRPWYVTELIDAGADPRIAAPSLNPVSKYDLYDTSALHEALRSGTFSMLMRMRVRKSDDIKDLLNAAFLHPNRAKIMYLVRIGGRRFTNDGGDDSLFDRCIWCLADGARFRSLTMARESDEAWAVIQDLARMGARWTPDRGRLNHLRYYMRFVDVSRLVELACVLAKSGAASRETVTAFFGTRLMKQQLGEDGREKIRAALAE